MRCEEGQWSPVSRSQRLKRKALGKHLIATDNYMAGFVIGAFPPSNICPHL
uniref:Uncharacterized protein n=1 Tax=Anguilla anguilla TaxID=7936 RepID=A0A0E9Q565_ANGAN